MVPTPECTLLRSAPYFPVENVEESADYYERVFGFKTEYRAGTPTEFAVCSRDGFAFRVEREGSGRGLRTHRPGGISHVGVCRPGPRWLHPGFWASGRILIHEPVK